MSPPSSHESVSVLKPIPFLFPQPNTNYATKPHLVQSKHFFFFLAKAICLKFYVQTKFKTKKKYTAFMARNVSAVAMATMIPSGLALM